MFMGYPSNRILHIICGVTGAVGYLVALVSRHHLPSYLQAHTLSPWFSYVHLLVEDILGLIYQKYLTVKLILLPR